MKKSFVIDNLLLIFVAVILVSLWIYGYVLEQHGYNLPDNVSEKSKVALAFIELGEHVYPWNMESVISEDGVSSYAGVKHSYEAYAGVARGIEDSEAGTEADGNDSFAGSVSENSGAKVADENKVKMIYAPVDQSYFDDALFIGDSRMEGVYEYAGIDNASYYARVSMTIFKLMDTDIDSCPGVSNVRQGLTDNTYGKIYIMVGINEMGTGDSEYFINAYSEVIDEIRALQPDAIIVVQGILHVTKERDSTDKIFNNKNINERNEALKALAEAKGVYYLDVNPVYDDADGCLRSDYSGDNTHLYGNKYGEWKEFLLNNGVVEDK